MDGFRLNLIACNGIIITYRYNSSYFKYTELEVSDYEPTSYVIENKPSIVVVDKEGVFPVKLDRNNIDCEEFPFELELMTETSKHFIAQLLSHEIGNKLFKPTSIIHNPKLIYGSDGFILNSEYFIKGVEDNFRFIRLITEENQKEIDISEFKDCLFDFKLDTKINLTYQEYNVAPEGGGIILIPKNKYESLFKSKVKRLNKYVIDNARIIEENENYVLYKIYDFKDKPILLKSLKNIDKKLLNKTDTIQEITSKPFKIKEGKILNELLKRYIKNQFIIPYDISRRKEEYKEAFSELSQYLDK